MYLRLGFQETRCRYLDRYEIVEATGAPRTFSDPCRFLVKDLTGGQREPWG